MAKRIYLSPSEHGVGQNKCRHSKCYEDKHTRPIAEACEKYLKLSGVEVKVAKVGTSMSVRCAESDDFKADLHVPIHTNAFSDKSVRRLVFMCIRTDGEYKKIFECVKNRMKDSYKGDVKLTKRTDLFEINVPKAKTFYCELGFHTNQYDCDNFIHNADARGKELAHGLCDYLGVTFKDKKEEPKKEETKPTTKTEPVAKTNVKVVSEDGVWGKDTTKYTQKLLKVSVDSIISGQRTSCKKYLPNAHKTSWEFKLLGRGSATIKALQKYIGMSSKQCDGLMGKASVTALQKFLKEKKFYTGAVDGIMGAKTVKAWQKFINSKF